MFCMSFIKVTFRLLLCGAILYRSPCEDPSLHRPPNLRRLPALGKFDLDEHFFFTILEIPHELLEAYTMTDYTSTLSEKGQED